jgi:hypothetical protein
MTVISDYLANQVIGVLRNTAFSGISNVYLGLFNGNPGAAGSGATEQTTNIRSGGRLAVTLNAASTGTTGNSAEIDFGVSDSSVTIAGWGIFDAASSGNLLLYGGLTPSISILENQTVKVPAGAISVDLS